MIVDSSSKTEQNVFLTFIRKKEGGEWEKPSNREGKKINLNLEEIVWVLEVLRRNEPEWTTIHKFGETTTKISIAWEKDQKEREKVVVQVNGYKKYLNYAESIVFKMLLEHLLDEKVIYSTIPVKGGQETSKEDKSSRVEEAQSEIPKMVVEEVVTKKKAKVKQGGESSETSMITGVFQGETKKALLILFENGKEAWIPKSTVHSAYSSTPEKQEFTIDTWVLEKNGIINEF